MNAPTCGLLFSTILVASLISADVPSLIASQSEPKITADLVLGTWHLNLARSKFNPGPAPKSSTRTYELYRDGIKTTVETIYADGHTAFVQFISDYTGDQVPVSGSPDADMLSLKRVDAHIAEVVLFHAGQEMGSARRTISDDGKTMTITVKMTNAKGIRVNDVQIFEKEESEKKEPSTK
jgi:hypothetical protein